MAKPGINNIDMELRILKDGRIVLVAPDSELLEAVEAITDNNHNIEECTNDGCDSSDRSEKS